MDFFLIFCVIFRCTELESEVPVRHPGCGCQVEFGVLSSGEHLDCEIYLRINSILVVSVDVDKVLREKRKIP